MDLLEVFKVDTKSPIFGLHHQFDDFAIMPSSHKDSEVQILKFIISFF